MGNTCMPDSLNIPNILIGSKCVKLYNHQSNELVLLIIVSKSNKRNSVLKFPNIEKNENIKINKGDATAIFFQVNLLL